MYVFESGNDKLIHLKINIVLIKRFIVVSLLGFSSGLPFALLGGTLQAWFADSGMSLMQTGLLSLLGLPYAYRFLFAPILDKVTFFNLGRRRSWMILTQLMLLIGFNLFALFQPTTDSNWMMLIAFGLTVCSATQDTIIDAQRVEYLSTQDYGLGVSLSVLGYRLALMMGGGVALVLAHYQGWATTYRVMGCLMSLGLFASFWSEEPLRATEESYGLQLTDWIMPIRDWLQRPQWLTILLFILCYKTGEAFTSGSSGIVMPFLRQELGFSLETIGYVNKGVGIIALLLGGLLAGWWLRKRSLWNALYWFGLFQAMSNLWFVVLASVGKQLSLLIIAVLLDNLASGMSSTALVVFIMRLVNQQYTATQFSLLIAMSLLPRIFSGPIGAFLQIHFGWVGMYGVAFGLSFLFMPFLWRLVKSMNYPWS